MKVKVEFEAEAEACIDGYWVWMSMGEFQKRVFFEERVCTPILPDFGDGDLVEHVPSGARGTAREWSGGFMVGSEDKALCVEVPRRAARGITSTMFWPAADCRIVRKAGEPE